MNLKETWQLFNTRDVFGLNSYIEEVTYGKFGGGLTSAIVKIATDPFYILLFFYLGIQHYGLEKFLELWPMALLILVPPLGVLLSAVLESAGPKGVGMPLFFLAVFFSMITFFGWIFIIETAFIFGANADIFLKVFAALVWIAIVIRPYYLRTT